jgi:hypothetical protein
MNPIQRKNKKVKNPKIHVTEFNFPNPKKIKNKSRKPKKRLGIVKKLTNLSEVVCDEIPDPRRKP